MCKCPAAGDTKGDAPSISPPSFTADVARSYEPSTCRVVIERYSHAPAPLRGTGALKGYMVR